MKTKKSILKYVIFFSICLTFILTTQLSIAAPYVQKTAQCPNCKTFNASYGHDENFTWTTITVRSGNYCEGCKKTVPTGEEHMYQFSKDRYFFLCKSASCKNLSTSARTYRVEYANPISSHSITYLPDSK